MASLRLSLFHLFQLFFCSFLLLPNAVHCNVRDEDILNAFNNYRKQKNLSALSQNDNAACLAEKLADVLQEEPCSTANNFSKDIGTDPQLSDFHQLLKKCHIDFNSTVDGIVLPVCVPEREPNSVLNNYTRTEYVRYLNNSNYTGAGVGTEDNWVVVVLSTNTSTGNFTSTASLVAAIGILHCLTAVFLGLFVSLTMI